MNWFDLTDFAQQQSTVFYVAALAVAAGLTLLLAAGIQQSRKWLARLPRLKRPAGKAGPKKIVLGQKFDRTDTTTFAVPSAMAPVESLAQKAPDSQARWDALSSRIEDIVQQLEEIQTNMASDSHFQKAFSELKPGSDGVEYICRRENS